MCPSENDAPHFDLQEWTRGTFYSHSCVSTMDLPYDAVADWSRILEPLDEDIAGGSGHGIKSNPLIPPGALENYLLVLHERHHHIQLVTTPLGVLQHRILNCLQSQLQFLFLVTEKHFSDPRPKLPLLEWYRSVSTRDSEMASRLMHAEPARFLKDQINAAETLITFWAALMGNSKLTMRAFVDLANRAWPVLAKISGCEARAEWSARDLDRGHYLPDHGLSTTELLEGQARLLEFSCLESAEAGSAAIESWKKKSLSGVYERAFKYTLDRIRHPIASMFMIDAAIATPLDVASSDGDASFLMVEDVLPSWRIGPLVNAIVTRPWPSDWGAVTHEVNEAIPRRAHLPTPHDALSSLAAARLSNWAAPRSVSSTVIAVDHAEEQMRQGMLRRLRNLQSTKTASLLPTWEFYSDRVVANVSADERGAGVAFSTLLHLVFTLASYSLLSNGSVSVISQLQTKLKEQGATFDFRDSLERNLPSAFARLLRW